MNPLWEQLTETERLILLSLHQVGPSPRSPWNDGRLLNQAMRRSGRWTEENAIQTECHEMSPLGSEFDNALIGLVHHSRNGEYLIEGFGNYGTPDGVGYFAHPIFRECRLSPAGEALLVLGSREFWMNSRERGRVRAINTTGERKARLITCAVCRVLGEWPSGQVASNALKVIEEFADTLSPKTALKTLRKVLRADMSHSTPKITQALESVEQAARERTFVHAVESVANTLLAGDRGTTEEIWGQIYSLYLDIAGPHERVNFENRWKSETSVTLARTMYESRDFGAMPVLADALIEAGCDDVEILGHCRNPAPHARGCWVVDLILSKDR